MRSTALTLCSRLAPALLAALATLFALLPSGTQGDTAETKRYIVVFSGAQAADGSFEVGGSYALNYGTALSLVQSAGGSVGRT